MPFEFPAPGWPGIPARWTSSAKSGVGTALTDGSRVWFTLSHGILNEIYYPRIDQACTRDFGLLVTDRNGFFSEEKRHTRSVIRPIADGVPAFAITSTCARGRYVIDKLVLSDPQRDVVLQRVAFRPLTGALADYRLFALLAPHLVNRGAGNIGWIGDYKGVPMLFASGSGTTLALGCSVPLLARSVGFVGISDGWQDLSRHGELRWHYDHARDGNIALVAEVDLSADAGAFVLAVGFGRNADEAALRVRASLSDGVDAAATEYDAVWRSWQGRLLALDRDETTRGTYRVSTAVLRAHEARSFAGGYIASLSIPWGFAKGDEDLGGYHLVWPRDLVQIAGGLLAAGAEDDARQVVHYLQAIQEADGHWPQNCWLDGTPYWNGIQLDETAFPILLVDLATRKGALPDTDLPGLWPMIRQATQFIVTNGPLTNQDRWEEDSGYSPYTLAIAIAALLVAADYTDRFGNSADAAYLRETADIWNEAIEGWTYASRSPLAVQLGVDGYYVRIAPASVHGSGAGLDSEVLIKNRLAGDLRRPASQIISPDALALVRFGLRAANDPHILATIRAIDATLKVELPSGPCWRRYNGDGYGEHEGGGPYDGYGIGRPWPLLALERAHYELAAGNRAGALALLRAVEGFASDGHLIPEQVWDAADIPERELVRGKPSGSAMPLAWAHAEHVKLLRSLTDGQVFDMPPQTRERYVMHGVHSGRVAWRFNNKCANLPVGHMLRIELLAPALIHWSADDWYSVQDCTTQPTGFGVHILDLDTAALAAGTSLVFTMLWTQENRWEGADYRVAVIDQPVASS